MRPASKRPSSPAAPSRPAAPIRALLPMLPLLKGLDAATLDRLAQGARRIPLARGEELFRIGDTPAGLYLVVFGDLRLMAGERGHRRLTGIAGPGRALGEAVMFLERPAVVDAIAASDALVLLLPRQAVFDELDRNPLFARRIIGALSARIEGLVRELDRQSLGTGRQRLIDYLRRLAGPGASGEQAVVLPASKRAIASQLHLTPEHFSRLLRELAAEGLVTVQARRLVLHDVARLAPVQHARRRRGTGVAGGAQA